MIDPHLLAAAYLTIVILVGLVRVFSLKSRINRLLSIQLLGTVSVAIVLLFAEGMALPGIRDLALVIGLLASVLALAFVSYGVQDFAPEERRHD